eukprot:gene26861-17371_t
MAVRQFAAVFRFCQLHGHSQPLLLYWRRSARRLVAVAWWALLRRVRDTSIPPECEEFAINIKTLTGKTVRIEVNA